MDEDDDDLPGSLVPFPRSRARPGGPDLGPLAQLSGSWLGTGVTVGYDWSAEADEPERCEAHATRETVTFAEIELPLPDEEQAQDEPLPAVYFLRRSNDAKSGARVHAESGTWLLPPEDGESDDPFGVLCLSKSLHEEGLAAVGAARLAAPPEFAPLSTEPDGDTSALPARLRSLLALPAGVAAPPGLSLADVEDPHRMLRAELQGAQVHGTVLSVSSGSASAIADALGHPGGTLPDRVRVEIELWVQSVGEDASAHRHLQLSRRLWRLSHGVWWPHISVAALRASGREPSASLSTIGPR